jgi:hypothetical protein
MSSETRDDDAVFYENVDLNGVDGIHLNVETPGVIISRQGDYSVMVKKGLSTTESSIKIRLMEVVVIPRQTPGASSEFKKKPAKLFHIAHEIDNSIAAIPEQPFGPIRVHSKPKPNGFHFKIKADDDDRLVFTLICKK